LSSELSEIIAVSPLANLVRFLLKDPCLLYHKLHDIASGTTLQQLHHSFRAYASLVWSTHMITKVHYPDGQRLDNGRYLHHQSLEVWLKSRLCTCTKCNCDLCFIPLTLVYLSQILAISHKGQPNHTDGNKLTHPGPIRQLAPGILPCTVKQIACVNHRVVAMVADMGKRQ